MERRALGLLLVLAALWGSSYMFIKIGLDDGLSPATIVFTRTLLGALALLPFAVRRHAFRGIRPLLPLAVLLAAVQVAGPFLLISAGEQHISSGLAGILVAAAPIFTALLAPVFDSSERSSGTALAGILIGILGVGLIFGVDLGDAGSALGGGLMVLAASAGYAIGGFIVKRSFSSLDAIGVVTTTMVLSALLSLPLAAATAPDAAPAGGTFAALLALGVGGTGIAFAIFYTLIGQIGPARTSLVAYVAPGFAVLYGVTLQDEELTLATIAGLVLIVAGSWLAGRSGGRAAPERDPPKGVSVPQSGDRHLFDHPGVEMSDSGGRHR
jgi:drug/metabolite transporter (DMT)-like permease